VPQTLHHSYHTGLARLRRPDLITIDLMMPGTGGVEAIRQLRADPQLRHIPVVVVSVVAEDFRGGIPGADACLDKAVTREALAEVLERFARPSVGAPVADWTHRPAPPRKAIRAA